MELDDLATAPGAEDASQHKHLEILLNRLAERGVISPEELARRCMSP